MNTSWDGMMCMYSRFFRRAIVEIAGNKHYLPFPGNLGSVTIGMESRLKLRSKKRNPLSAFDNSRKGKKSRRNKGVHVEHTFDDAMTLKEQQQFSRFESALLDICKTGRDIDDRVRAVYELALYYCQVGNFEKADSLLRILGFRYRLGSNLWTLLSHCSQNIAPITGSRASNCACFDNVFPATILRKLLGIFNEQSLFWSDHNYPADTFFSYNTPIGDATCSISSQNNIIMQIANYLKPLVRESFPLLDIDDVTSVEWWAHTRPDGPSAGHRLHYDMDEVALKNIQELGAEHTHTAIQNGTLHPYVSSVLYLDDGGSSGAPTLMIDQRLDGVGSDTAWTCTPKPGRLLLFDGRLLHGVPPHIRPHTSSSTSTGPRLTLMIGWWGKNVHTCPYTSGRRLPNMQMPPARAGGVLGWPSLFAPLGAKDHNLLLAHSSNAVGACNTIQAITGSVWEQIADDSCDVHVTIGEDDVQPLMESVRDVEKLWVDTGIVFVGNWFLRTESGINDEILSPMGLSKGENAGVCEYDESGNGMFLGETEETNAKDSDVSWISLEDFAKLRGGGK